MAPPATPAACRRPLRWTLTAAGFLALTLLTAAAGDVTNPFSQFPITTDGQFTDGTVGTAGEWLDVTPATFHSPLSPGDPIGFIATSGVGDPRTNSLLYASLAVEDPGDSQPEDELYLMYDYLPSAPSQFTPGQFVADISFPIHVDGAEQAVTVQVRGSDPQNGHPVTGVPNSFFDVLVDLDQNGSSDRLAVSLGMEAGVGFGASPASGSPHLMVELAVPLLIPPDFGPAFPGGGLNPVTGLYDPDPAFWGAGFGQSRPGGQPKAAAASGDPPGSAGLFRINPDGSTTVSTANLVTQVVNVACDHPITPKSNGLVPVSLLGSGAFNVANVVLPAVQLNGKSVGADRVAVGDVNGDGIRDLTLTYRARALAAAGAVGPTTTTLVVVGKTGGPGGGVFGGTTTIRVVP